MPSECGKPLVSVVIATFNCAEFVGDAIESVLRQTYRPIEVIVVDDGSTDNTREEVAGFGSRVRYVHQENKGQAAARNLGVQVAAGEFIALQDADDISSPDRIRTQMDFLARHAQVAVAGSDAWVTDVRRRPLRLFSQAPEVRQALKEASCRCIRCEQGAIFPRGKTILPLLRRLFLNGPGMLIAKEVFSRVGGYDQRLRNREDYDLVLRIAMGHDIGYIDQPLYFLLRGRDDHVTNNSLRHHKETIEIVRKFQRCGGGCGRRLRRAVNVRIAGRRTLMAALLAKRGDLVGARKQLWESVKCATRPVPLLFLLSACSGPIGRAMAPTFVRRILGEQDRSAGTDK